MIPLSSSYLSGCEYDESTRTLTISFHDGRTWSYTGVGREVYDDLLHTASPGKYFHRNIKDQFSGSPA
jgi:hypothetical protein